MGNGGAMRQIFEPLSYDRVPDGTRMSAFLNAADLSQDLHV